MGEDKYGLAPAELGAAARALLQALPQGFLPVPAGRWIPMVGKAGGLLRMAAATAQEEVQAVRAMEDIRTPEDLPPGRVVLASGRMKLNFETPSTFGYDVHWLKEIAESALRGTTGIRVDAGCKAQLRATIGGDFTAAAAREDVDGQAGIRVAVARARSLGLAATGALRIEAKAETPPGTGGADLLSALVGIHPLQWLHDLLNELGSSRVAQTAGSVGATLRAVDAVREMWAQMGARAEAALWKALSDSSQWRSLRDWVQVLASEETTGAEVASRIQSAIEGDPGFGQSAAGEWLAAAAGAALDAVSGTEPMQRLRSAAGTLTRLAAEPGVEQLLLKLPEQAAREVDWNALWPWAQGKLEELFGKRAASLPGIEAFGDWKALCARIQNAAQAALERKWTAGLAVALDSTAGSEVLADATFAFTAEGLAAARRVFQGDLGPLFQSQPGLLRLRAGKLTHSLRRSAYIELHLPFLGRRRWQRDLLGIASAQAVPQPDGRVLVQYDSDASDSLAAGLRWQSVMVLSAALAARDGTVTRDNFTLGFTDTRPLADAGGRDSYQRLLGSYGLEKAELGREGRVTLALSVPGALAETWFKTPPPTSPDYIAVMGGVARAVQAMARRWLPALYLSNLDAYRTPSAVYPLLAWQCTPPALGPRKSDLAPDVMDPQAVQRILDSCAPSFPAALARAEQLLRAEGRTQTAGYYTPSDWRYILARVYGQRRNFVALLLADTFFVEAVLHVAECARELDRLVRVKPGAAVGALAKFTREAAETFHRKLRRLYAGEDYVALGALFFVEATAALAGPGSAAAGGPAATLTVETPQGRRVYLNEAARKMA